MLAIKAINFIRFPAKKHTLLPLKHSLVFKIRLSNDQALSLWKLGQVRHCREEAVCQIVENCQVEIRRRLESFFAQCAVRVIPFAEGLLAGRKSFSLVAFQDEVVPQSECELLLQEIRRYIQSEIKQYFGVSSLVSMNWSVCDQETEAEYIACLIGEYRRTLSVAEFAAKLGDKACQESFFALKLPSLAGDVLDKIALGSALLRVFDCHPRQGFAQRRQSLIAQIKGLLRTVHWHIATEACQAAARNFYELYDLTWEPYYEKEAQKIIAPHQAGLVSQLVPQHKAV
ncbi:MAG: hypothetical protein P4N59_30030 [Negativicutes bacterium]|nr:hypothetical protein [Negativicutes bacterium]